MKILFLANEVPDYLQDLVFHGLVTMLGPENVFEYPRIERFHRPPPDFRYSAMHYLDLPDREVPA